MESGGATLLIGTVMSLIIHEFITCKLRSRDQTVKLQNEFYMQAWRLCSRLAPHENTPTLSHSVTIAQEHGNAKNKNKLVE